MIEKKVSLEQNNSFSKQVKQYTLMFIVAAVCAYVLFILVPRTFLSNTDGSIDGIAQTYPIYTEIKRNIHSLLTGQGFNSWSWDIGLGDDRLMEFNTKLLNPLTYFAIAFPQKYLDVGITLMFAISQYLSGFFFLLFGKKIEFDARQNTMGALCYAFCGWVVYAIMRQGTFLMATMLLPLLILGLEKVFRKESPLLFIIIVALHIIYSIQWAYVGAITIVIYFFTRALTKYTEQPVFKLLPKFIGFGVVGILISSIVLVGSLSKMFDATTSSTVDTPILYTLSEYLEMPTGLFAMSTTTRQYTVICLPIICIVLLPIAIKNIKKHNTPAIMTLMLFVLSLLPITGSLFNGFSYSVGRWFYVLDFFAIWMTMEEYKESSFEDASNIKTMKKWIIGLTAYGCLVCGIIVGNISTTRTINILVEAIIGYLLIVLLAKGYMKKTGIAQYIPVALVIISIAGYVNFNVCPGFGENIHDLCQVGRIESDFSQSTQKVGVEVQKTDKSFYRIDQVDGYTDARIARVRANENMYFGNRSVYTYLSTMNSIWHEFHKTVGNNAGYFDRTTVYSNDNREGLDLLTGVKYFLGDSTTKKAGANEYAPYGFEKRNNIEGVDILENKYCIGLGSSYDKYITTSELMKYSPLEREQVMLQVAVIDDEEVDKVDRITHATVSDIKTDVTKAKADVDGIKNGKFTVDQSHHDFTINLPKIENSRVVISFEGLEREKCNYENNAKLEGVGVAKNPIARYVASVSYDDDEKFKIELQKDNLVKAAQNRKGKNQGYSDVKDYYINLGYFDSIEGAVNVNIDRSGEYTYDEINVYIVPMNIYEDSAKKLQNNALKVSSFEGDVVTGTIETDAQSVLYTSILNQPGWDIYVDGEKIERLDKGINIAFTGAVIKSGKHSIVLEYNTPGVLYGIMLSIMGIIIAVIIDRKYRNAV